MRRIALVSFLLSLSTPSSNSCSLKLDKELDFKAKKSVFVYISPQGCIKCIPAFFTFLDSFSLEKDYRISIITYRLNALDQRNLFDYIRKYYPRLDELHNQKSLRTFRKASGIDPSRIKDPSVLINTEKERIFLSQDSVMSGTDALKESFRLRMRSL